MLGVEFQDELFLALNPEDPIRVAKNIGTEMDFQDVLLPVRIGLAGGERCFGFSEFHA